MTALTEDAWDNRLLTFAHEAWQAITPARRPPLVDAGLLEGVARDLGQARYHSFDELATYCYGVASTVGLMSTNIIGYEDEEVIPYAVKLGVALQLTNILRDVAEDWRRGRLYLPLDELKAYRLAEEDVAVGQ
jgi:phytoene synthase